MISAAHVLRLTEIGLTAEQYHVVLSILVSLDKAHEEVNSKRLEVSRRRTALYRSRGGGNIPDELRLQVYERDGYQCVYCGSDERLECDHVIPVSKGGTTTFDNLAAACRTCNARKKDRLRKFHGNSTEINGNSTEIPPIKERSPTPPKENIYIYPRAREAWPSDYRELFWTAYPRKIGKAGAMRRLDQIRGQVPFQRIMDAVRKYCSANPDPKYIKHPETWLNKGCWDDELTTSITPFTAPRKGFYAPFTSREREVWDAYGRQIGVTYPKDKNGGWEFPSRWPPGHEATA